MTNEEIERLTGKIYPQVKNIPGVDKNFIQKCLVGINSLGDPQVEATIKMLAMFL